MAQTKLSKHWEKANQQVQVEHSHFKDTGREIQVAFRKAFVKIPISLQSASETEDIFFENTL